MALEISYLFVENRIAILKVGCLYLRVQLLLLVTAKIADFIVLKVDTLW